MYDTKGKEHLQIGPEEGVEEVIFDKIIDLETTPSGHYFIPIRDCNILKMYTLLLKKCQ